MLGIGVCFPAPRMQDSFLWGSFFETFNPFPEELMPSYQGFLLRGMLILETDFHNFPSSLVLSPTSDPQLSPGHLPWLVPSGSLSPPPSVSLSPLALPLPPFLPLPPSLCVCVINGIIISTYRYCIISDPVPELLLRR